MTITIDIAGIKILVYPAIDRVLFIFPGPGRNAWRPLTAEMGLLQAAEMMENIAADKRQDAEKKG